MEITVLVILTTVLTIMNSIALVYARFGRDKLRREIVSTAQPSYTEREVPVFVWNPVATVDDQGKSTGQWERVYLKYGNAITETQEQLLKVKDIVRELTDHVYSEET